MEGKGMTIISDDMLRELRWLAASKLAITVVPKPVLAELVAVWEAARSPHPDRLAAGDGAKQLRLIFNPSAPELPLFQPDPIPLTAGTITQHKPAEPLLHVGMFAVIYIPTLIGHPDMTRPPLPPHSPPPRIGRI
jgi:hypothetical protein